VGELQSKYDKTSQQNKSLSSSSYESLCSVGSMPDDGMTSEVAAGEIGTEREAGSEHSALLRPRVSATLVTQLPSPSAQPEETDIEIIIGSEDWHSTLPLEWVPIITRDATRQRRQAAPAMFSNAYLAGMPNKRRKIMSRDHQPEEFTDLRIALPETLRRSAQRVGATALTTTDLLSRDAANDQQLCEAFRQEVSTAIRQRIADDPEYSADKFPNTDKFFKD